MKTSSLSAICIAALSVICGIALLNFTEEFNPAGSPIGWLIMMGMMAGHVPLLSGRCAIKIGRESSRTVSLGIAILSVSVAIGAQLLAFAGILENIFRVPVLPADGAQLGLITQVANRMETNDFLYGYTYIQNGAHVLASFPVGTILPFALARGLGLDWRFASVGACALLFAILAGGIVQVFRSAKIRNADLNSSLVAMSLLGGAAWICFGRTMDFFNWGHTVVLWPLIAALGFSLSWRKPLLVAVIAGLLAAMNAGWILMLIPIGCWLFRERRESFLPLVFLLLIFPIVAYTLFHAEADPMLQGIFGQLFAEGRSLQQQASWRYASLHAITDSLHLRYFIYSCGLALVIYASRLIVMSHAPRRRITLLIACVFVIVACGPTTYFFHWLSYAVFLASVVPSFVIRNQASDDVCIPEKPTSFFPALATGMLSLVIASIFVARVTAQPHADSINSLAGHAQSVDRDLFSGFNIRSQDHAWGKNTRMVTGFTMDRRYGGLLEIHLGTLGGDFTPINRTTIKVNGRVKGAFRVLPGEYRYASIPLSRNDVVYGFNTVELEPSWARTPRSLGVADDDRMLSINYLGMRFLPREETQLATQK